MQWPAPLVLYTEGKAILDPLINLGAQWVQEMEQSSSQP